MNYIKNWNKLWELRFIPHHSSRQDGVQDWRLRKKIDQISQQQIFEASSIKQQEKKQLLTQKIKISQFLQNLLKQHPKLQKIRKIRQLILKQMKLSQQLKQKNEQIFEELEQIKRKKEQSEAKKTQMNVTFCHNSVSLQQLKKRIKIINLELIQLTQNEQYQLEKSLQLLNHLESQQIQKLKLITKKLLSYDKKKAISQVVKQIEKSLQSCLMQINMTYTRRKFFLSKVSDLKFQNEMSLPEQMEIKG